MKTKHELLVSLWKRKNGIFNLKIIAVGFHSMQYFSVWICTIKHIKFRHENG
jgi:hypothetical protein